MSSDEPGGLRSPRLREARRKPEFAHFYPPLEPDRWEPAALRCRVAPPERDEAPVARTGASDAVGDTGIEPVTPSV